jgi:hypothetical protein
MNLTDPEKELLRFIVSGIRAKNLKEEFILAWGTNGPVVGFKDNEGWLPFPSITKARIAALEREGMICLRTSSAADGEHAVYISITQAGYEAVDSQFTEKKKPDTEWIKIWLQVAALIVSVAAIIYAAYRITR